MSISQSVYLLGQNAQQSASLERYRHLKEQCLHLGEFLSVEDFPEWLACYERDAQSIQTKWPLLVFRPHDIACISPFIKYCYQLKMSVTVRCGGTSLTGGSVPSTESVILLTGHLKQIKHYDPFHGTLSLEPGVTLKQLNHHIEAEGWIFPLEIATAGIAGFAGCLSAHARGYHQQEKYLFDVIQSVTLVDGKGNLHHQIPSALVCGSEGLWGIIIEVHLKLKHRLFKKLTFVVQKPWEVLLTQLPELRTLQALAFIVHSDEKFYVGLEGEEWRLTHASAFLTKLFQHSISTSQSLPLFMATRPLFLMLTSTLSKSYLSDAIKWALELAYKLDLECLHQIDVLAGSVHLILQANLVLYTFNRQTQTFLVLWTDYVDRHKGNIGSCHGIGRQLSPYMPPFWSEETLFNWQKLHQLFDPGSLLVQDRFFPAMGKSLEKVRDDG